MKLIRGDENNLLGRVISFSKCNNPEAIAVFERKPIIAFYATSDIDSFIKRIGATDELAKDLRKNDIAMREDAKKKGNLKLLSNYVSPITLEDETQLEEGDEDLLNTGEYNSLEDCCYAAELGIKFYILHIEEKFTKEKQIKKPIEPINQNLLVENYSQVEKSKIGQYLKENFILPALEAYTRKDKLRGKNLTSALITFCADSQFNEDARLLAEILDQQKSSNYGLIEDYIGKIQAITSEDYESAARFRDKILKRLKQGHE